MKTNYFILLSVLFVLIFNENIKSQNSNQEDSSKCKVKLNCAADIMSSYIWRGTEFGNSPSIQPTLALSYKNLELGYWGAIATNSFYREIDFYIEYKYKNLSLLLTDYYIPSVTGQPASPDTRYLIFDDKKTAHSIEASATYSEIANTGLWLQSGVFFYGNDKRWGYDLKKDTTEATYYSSYFETGYNFKFKENSADLFVGFTPQAGAYGNTLGVINVGATGYRTIKFSNEFDLPIKASVIVNPQTSNIYFTFGFSL